MEPGPPPTAPTEAPTTQQKVPGPQSSSLTGQGPRTKASTTPARAHRGWRQPPRPQPSGHHILQGRHSRPPGAPDGTGDGVGPPPSHLPGTRPTTRQPSRTHPHIYPGLESVQMLLAQGDPPICPGRHPRLPRPPPQHPREMFTPFHWMLPAFVECYTRSVECYPLSIEYYPLSIECLPLLLNVTYSIEGVYALPQWINVTRRGYTPFLREHYT